MNGSNLKEIAIKAYGERGWQRSLATYLSCDVSSVRRWVSGKSPVPHLVKMAVEKLVILV